ncbi:MAG TPA: glycosyltransferase family 2 protein [Candidatus Binatia bacterium]|nr:glycosyltransferase family 2 protein [Candidatus Binatia bacterium]
MFKPCVVIPVYNHENAVAPVVHGVLAQNLSCIIVDDGSSPSCASLLDALAAAAPGQITLIRHPVNRGKGSAVLTGIRRAAQLGYTHALQIDADGQHRVSDIQRFLKEAAAHPQALIIGCPDYGKTVPALRFYSRYLTHVWVWINTLSLQIKDSMCGFRVYPLPPIIALDQRRKLGERMNFDTEVLVRLYWEGLEIVNLSTPVVYPSDGVSHFRGVLDNILISRMHATLFFGMLLRLPVLFARTWRAR